MSEKLSPRSEKSESHNNHEAKKHHEKIKSSIEEKARSAKHEHGDNIENIRSKIEHEAVAKHEQRRSNKERDRTEDEHPVLVNRELKNISYQRTLKRTQAKLSAPSRAFSKIVHQPVIDSASELAGKTIARPSGVLAGGITAFIGSSIFLWAARHYGYEYNFFLLALLFAGGFLLGLTIELVIRLTSSKKS